MPRRKQKNPHDLGFDQQGILRYSMKTQSTKEKPDESDFIKVRSAACGSPAKRGGKQAQRESIWKSQVEPTVWLQNTQGTLQM